MKMSEFDKLRNKLCQYKRNNMILSAKSEYFSRIENIWTTGVAHEFDPYNEKLRNKYLKSIGKKEDEYDDITPEVVHGGIY